MNKYQIDLTECAKLGIFEQMANIGSEVDRAINAHRKGNNKRVDGAINHAIDLIDSTIECLISQGSSRVREVLR